MKIRYADKEGGNIEWEPPRILVDTLKQGGLSESQIKQILTGLFEERLGQMHNILVSIALCPNPAQATFAIDDLGRNLRDVAQRHLETLEKLRKMQRE
jgi:S-adenosylmethionine synthetase